MIRAVKNAIKASSVEQVNMWAVRANEHVVNGQANGVVFSIVDLSSFCPLYTGQEAQSCFRKLFGREETVDIPAML